MRYRDREDAGKRLAARLEKFRHRDNLRVLALPRGGVPVAREICDTLDLPLEVLIVRKVGVPDCPELALGAVASAGIRIRNEPLLRRLNLSEGRLEKLFEEREHEVESRERVYGKLHPALVRDHTIVLVDDGVATGSTMLAAVEALRQQRASAVVVAVPVGPRPTVERLERAADELICLQRPWLFESVGRWYSDFSQVSDSEVRRLLSNRLFPQSQ